MATKRCKYCNRPLTVADRLFGSGACVKCYEKHPKGSPQSTDKEACPTAPERDCADNAAPQPDAQENQTESVRFTPDVLDALETLHLTKSASREDVMKRYKMLVQQYLPDKVSSLGPEMSEIAQKKTLQLHAAYEVVMGFFDRRVTGI